MLNEKNQHQTEVAETEGEEHPIWDLIKDCEIPIEPIRGDIKGRAIASLRSLLRSYFDDEMKVVQSLDQFVSNEYDLEINKSLIKQIKYLSNNVPTKLWEVAEQWVKEDKESAVIYLYENDNVVFEKATFEFLMNVTLKIIQYDPHQIFELMIEQTRKEESDWMLPRIETAGGKHVVLIYAVCLILFRGIFDTWLILTGTGKADIKQFDNEKYVHYLRRISDLWQEPFKTRIEIIHSLPSNLIDLVANEIAVHQTQSKKKLAFLSNKIRKGVEDKRNLEVQLQSIKKKHNELEKAHEKLLRKVKEVVSDSKALVEVNATTPVLSASKDDDQIRAKLRIVEREAQRHQAENQKLQAELANLREFTQRLLTPTQEPNLSLVKKTHQEIRDSRIVFIGGHERLHAKLRKEMPNAQFIHPDQSKFTSDILIGVDAVIFCTHYCNHRIFGRAVDEVRQLKICAGYTSHNNLEQIYDDIANVLTQS